MDLEFTENASFLCDEATTPDMLRDMITGHLYPIIWY
jgi:hypothetical protein